MEYHRILTMQDISCVGQCSAAVAIPVLSACGQETCLLPTAVLSTHTGGFSLPHIRILAGDMKPIQDHWKRENIDFEFIYTGYLGSIEEIRDAEQITENLLAPGGKVIVDPAMADHGRLYNGLDETYADAMKNFCRKADVILPNITEAAMMSGMPFLEHYGPDYIQQLISLLDIPCILLTGVSYEPDQTGVVIALDGKIEYYSHPRFAKNFHGTGDLFASAFTGAWASGKEIYEAARIAADFTCRCIKNTCQNPAHWYGVKFETALPYLMNLL